MHKNIRNSLMNSKEGIILGKENDRHTNMPPDLVQQSSINYQDSTPSLQRPSKLPKYGDDRLFDPLHLSIKRRGGTSPPPPALSPASLSPEHSSACNPSSHPSPAPPVIMEEDGSLSSGASNPPSSNNPSNLLFIRTSLPVLPSKPFEKRNCAPTESLTSSSSSETCSSSASCSSALSVAGELNKPPLKTNGVSILEKASVTLNCTTSPTRAPVVKQPIQVNAVEYPIESVESEVPQPQLDIVDISKPADVSKKPPKKAPVKKRRAPKNRWPRGSESEFECTIVKRAKSCVQKNVKSRQKASRSGGNVGGAHTNAAEVTFQRRYLESPFFCLCQTPSAATTTTATTNYSKPANPDIPTACPAHVINPALKESIPVDEALNCPVLQASSNTSHRKHTPKPPPPTSELQAFFTASLYKPSLRPCSGRDNRLPSGYSEAACPSWCCVFCGEGPTYLRLGPLYGPYFLSPATQLRFPSSAVAAATNCAPSPSLRLIIKAISPPASGSISVASVKPNTPQKPKLRRASKAKKTATAAVSETGQLMAENRVGKEGEVWLHMECALWAPGTYLQGDGRIGGLDDAVCMSMDVACSYCKKPGAIMNCRNRGCSLCYHYNCASLTECHFNREQFTVLCKKHFVYT